LIIDSCDDCCDDAESANDFLLGIKLETVLSVVSASLLRKSEKITARSSFVLQ